MTTKDNANLDVEYLEVVTCTSTELQKLKKPVNGRLYHTSDTNKFYFDWNNRRQELSVFPPEKSSSNGVTKTELNNFLKENNYLTNLSLTEALVDIIGSPIEDVITKQALDAYMEENHLLTKNESLRLRNPSDMVNNIQGMDEKTYNFFSSLATQISEVRDIANSKISEEQLQNALNEYIKESVVKSLYLKKDEGNTIYINEEELQDKLKGYITTQQLNNFLKQYTKTSDLNNNYLTKEENNITLSSFAKMQWVIENFLQRKDILSILKSYVDNKSLETKLEKFETKENADEKSKKNANELKDIRNRFSNYVKSSELDSKLNTYVKKEDLSNISINNNNANKNLSDYEKKSDLEKKLANYETKEDINNKLKNYPTKNELSQTYVTKSKLSGYVTDEELKPFAKMDWVDTYYERKGGDLELRVLNLEKATKTDLSNYETKEDVNNKLKNYATKSDVSKNYVNKETIADYVKSTELKPFAKMDWVDTYYARKNELDSYLKKNEATTKYLEKTEATSTYLTKEEANKLYAKKGSSSSQGSGIPGIDIVEEHELNSFAKMDWVDTYYMRKGQYEGIKNAMVMSSEFSKYEDLKRVQDKINQGFYYLTEDNQIWCAVENPEHKPNKILINITDMKIDQGSFLYFGGDVDAHTNEW